MSDILPKYHLGVPDFLHTRLPGAPGAPAAAYAPPHLPPSSSRPPPGPSRAHSQLRGRTGRHWKLAVVSEAGAGGEEARINSAGDRSLGPTPGSSLTSWDLGQVHLPAWASVSSSLKQEFG